MERWSDKLRALLLSVAIHAIAGFALFVGLAWTEAAKPVSVQGPVVEAVLVSAPLAAAAPPPRVPRPRPEPPRPKPPEPPAPEPPEPALVRELPPPPAEDTREQERVAREGVLPPVDARREQEERRRREQELLEAEQLSRMERERLQQLEDIRRLRQQAEERRRREQEQLARLEREAPPSRSEAPPSPAPPTEAQPAPGNEGVDDDLRARYALAIQTVVTQNWLRPDTAQPGLRCTVRIVQIPGGEVISASVVPPCNGDDLTRRSLEAAVLRAQPLPYRGYESVFTRSIDFDFRYDG